jgi:ABC-type Fe2+-enterobactin transport system substrate-binding protein
VHAQYRLYSFERKTLRSLRSAALTYADHLVADDVGFVGAWSKVVMSRRRNAMTNGEIVAKLITYILTNMVCLADFMIMT